MRHLTRTRVLVRASCLQQWLGYVGTDITQATTREISVACDRAQSLREKVLAQAPLNTGSGTAYRPNNATFWAVGRRWRCGYFHNGRVAFVEEAQGD